MKTEGYETKNMKKLLVTSILLLVCNSNINASDIWSGFTKITHLYPTSGVFIFNTEYSNTTYSSCDNGKRFSINTNNVDYKVQVSVLTAAFMAGKEIHMHILDRPVACNAVIDRFIVR